MVWLVQWSELCVVIIIKLRPFDGSICYIGDKVQIGGLIKVCLISFPDDNELMPFGHQLVISVKLKRFDVLTKELCLVSSLRMSYFIKGVSDVPFDVIM